MRLNYPLLALLVLSIFSFRVFAQESMPDSCIHEAPKQARKAFEQGVKLFNESGKYQEALEFLRKAVDIDPSYTEAYLNIARIGKQTKKEQLMLRNYEKVLELCPEGFPEAQFEIGRYYFTLQEWDKAIGYLERFRKMPDAEEGLLPAVENMLYKASTITSMLKNPVPFDPKPIRKLCTKADEYLAIISPDQEMCFFTRRYEKFNKGMITPQNVEEFTVALADTNRIFNEGVKMQPPFNSNNNEGGPSVTIDNNDLYFTICKPNAAGKINCDIYHSHYDEYSGEWSEIKSLGKDVNDPVAWDSQPSIASDGKTLYFASGRDGGYGGTDIYKSVRKPDGTWGKPENLGPQINTGGNEKSPFLHTDSHTLYFASDSLPGLGGYDIFLSRFKDGIGWETPKNIGYPISSTDDDIAFYVNTQGDNAYFSSNKINPNGGWDVYSFDLYKEARPKQVLFVKGKVFDDLTQKAPFSTHVELKNLTTKEITRVKVDSLTGKFVTTVNFDADYSLSIKKPGYVYESKVFRRDDPNNAKPLTFNSDIKPLEMGKTYTLKDVNFATNSSELTAEAKLTLGGLIDFMKENPGIKISIEGHTDNVNDDAYNQRLSENRAHSVFDFLVESGIDNHRLSYIGYGEIKPITTNDTQEGRAKNRRTEFRIVAL